jgi:hypothetical protein
MLGKPVTAAFLQETHIEENVQYGITKLLSMNDTDKILHALAEMQRIFIPLRKDRRHCSIPLTNKETLLLDYKRVRKPCKPM